MLRFSQQFPSEYASKFQESPHPLSLFNDCSNSPFGLPNLVLESSKIGVPIGDWAKPSSFAAAIHSIFRLFQIGCIVSHGFSISKSQLDSSFPALLLIPALFGLERFDLTHLPFLQLCLCAEGSLGFVSGKRSASYYVVGFDSQHFAYFDPHTSRSAVVNAEGFSSYYTLPPNFIKFADINPSILLGFIVSTQEHLLELIDFLMGCQASPVALTEDFDEALCDCVLDLDAVLETAE
jgi:hypothetical protein